MADFYALFQTRPQAPAAVHVCDDIACRVRGAEALCADVEAALGPAGESRDGFAAWHRSPCLGLCERAPAALVIVAGDPPRERDLAPANPADILSVLAGDSVPVPDLAVSVPQAGQPGLKLLARVGRVDPMSLDDYRAADGFLALRRAFEMGAAAVVKEVVDSKLVGRGGAAFPTGVKWQGARSAALPRYLVCNADESEPGTFKDRVLMENDPFSLIEAMTIAGFATGCEQGFLYIRGEYPLAHARLQNAIERCRERGLLGDNILGDGVRFDIELRRGRRCLHLRRGNGAHELPGGAPRRAAQQAAVPDRSRPVRQAHRHQQRRDPGQRPAHRDRRRKSLCRHRHRALRRPQALLRLRPREAPGVYEAPFGITLGELIALAGGVGGSGRLQAILMGGAAGAFITPDHLDVPVTFEGLRAIGASLGSAVVMPFDDTVDLRQILRRIAQFFRDESCGQCVPCRVGTVRQEELLARLAAGQPVNAEEELLKELGQVMRDASICGLGQTASSAIESALARFPIFRANPQAQETP